MTKTSWQEHFKSYIENAENLYSKDSTNVSLLLFCLRAKMIPIHEYLEWAKENFELPVLSTQFFKIHQPKKDFFKIWQKIYNWSPECMPIAEWDGALIIACLEIPQDYKNQNPTVFVLTSHQVLDATWEIYQKSERSAESDFTDMTALAATVVATKNYVAEDDSLLLEDHEESEHSEESSEEEHSEESHEAIEGLDLSAMGDNSGAIPEGLNFDAPAPVNPFSSLTPNNAVNAPAPVAPVAATPKKGPRSTEPIMNITIADLNEKTRIDTLVPVDDEVDYEAPPMPERKNISPMSPNAAPTAAAGPLPTAPVRPMTSLSGETASYLLEKVRKVGRDQFDKDAQASFQQLKTFFKKSMLLAIGDKDRMVKPLLWDHGFDSAEGGAPEFNLKTPSIFRIVSGTQKPYHGFVTVNDLNESFFESWNHGQIPDHVTLVPLMDGDLVVGMLMGLGEKSNYNKSVLNFTENIAKELSLKILKTPLSKSA
jgi:hypothetical protein